VACDPNLLRTVSLFSLLDDDELAVLASHVEMREFTAHQRIYKLGDSGGRAYVLVSGKVKVATIDEDHQELTVDEPPAGGLFGIASLLDNSVHQTSAVAVEPTACIQIEREDIETLVRKKPDAALDMLAVLGRQLHTAHRLARGRSLRNPNEVIEQRTTLGERLADSVARFGGSWKFIGLFGVILVVYTAINTRLGGSAWDPYPFILLNLVLSMLAAIQAPVIMMSQNRQDSNDRVRAELDFEVNRKAEVEIRGLAEKLNSLADQVGDIAELVRTKPLS
jgi:uncharacterized membrane protein